MPYTPREAMIVALYNANVEPLTEAHEIALRVMENLERMGFEVVDRDHEDGLQRAFRAYQEARAKHPSALPERLAHLSVVTDAHAEG